MNSRHVKGEDPAVTSRAAERDALRNETRRLWSARTGREVSDDDAREIERNIVGFFQTLLAWERSASASPKSDDDVDGSR